MQPEAGLGAEDAAADFEDLLRRVPGCVLHHIATRGTCQLGTFATEARPGPSSLIVHGGKAPPRCAGSSDLAGHHYWWKARRPLQCHNA